VLRGTFAMVDLRAIKQNVQAVKSLLSRSTKLLVTVKANGYGHGALDAATAALAGGADWLAVATPEEALQLRQVGVRAPLLCLGAVTPEAAMVLADAHVDITLGEFWDFKALPEFASPLSVHLKLDTGMTRLGLRSESDAVRLWRQVAARSDMRVAGVYTHLAAADAENLTHAETQIERFREIVAALHAAGLPDDAIIHAANSAAALRRSDWHFDMVRLGISAYGYAPSDEFESPVVLSPGMHFYTSITRITQVPAGTTVGYGATWTAPRDSQIATLAVGYADGYFRTLSNRAYVLISGKLAPVIGRVCMDQLMVDITDIENVEVGQLATLFGRSAPPDWNWRTLAGQSDAQQADYLIRTFREFEQVAPDAPVLSAETVAHAAGTISYELLCAVSNRVPRCVVPL
jgi:alanine racemase